MPGIMHNYYYKQIHNLHKFQKKMKTNQQQKLQETSKERIIDPEQEDKEMSDLEKKLKAITIRKQERRRRQGQVKAKKRKVLLEYYDALDQIEKQSNKIIQLVKRRKSSLEPRIDQLRETTDPFQQLNTKN